MPLLGHGLPALYLAPLGMQTSEPLVPALCSPLGPLALAQSDLLWASWPCPRFRQMRPPVSVVVLLEICPLLALIPLLASEIPGLPQTPLEPSSGLILGLLLDPRSPPPLRSHTLIPSPGSGLTLIPSPSYGLTRSPGSSSTPLVLSKTSSLLQAALSLLAFQSCNHPAQ